MKKSQILKDVGFDFAWDPQKVWSLDEPVTEMRVSELLWLFDIPFWDKQGTDEWNLTPWEVVHDGASHRNHADLVDRADTQYPIDIMEHKGRWLTLDGLHRLVKSYIQGKEKVNVRIIPRSRIPEILRSKV